MQVQIPAWLLPAFLTLWAFYGLFSLLTLLASRDFCENVFLVNACRFNIVGFAVTVAIWPREVVSCRDFILRAVATFWAMSLFGIYPGRASCTEIPPLSYSGFQFTIIMKGR